MATAAEAYADAGYMLAAWNRRFGKGPRDKDWGLRAFPPDQITDEHNIGLNHALSRTCVLDIDDFALTQTVLEEFGLDLEELAASTMSYRGNPERIKLVFKAPDPMLGVKKLQILSADSGAAHVAFELRGAKVGGQAQDVLPPRIHPGTNKPYKFETRLMPRDELPTLPEPLLDIWACWDEWEPTLRELLGDTTVGQNPRRRSKKAVEAKGAEVTTEFNRRYECGEILERNCGFHSMPGHDST